MEKLPGIHSKRVKKERRSHKQISEELKGLYPGVRGPSVRSVTRFCDRYDIHTSYQMKTWIVISSNIAKVN